MTDVLSTNARDPAAGPWRVTLVTNPDDCTLSCDMCPCGLARGGDLRRPPRRMEPALALAVLEERRGTPLREVIPSTMGEPLLWRGLDALLASCARQELRVNVTTSGAFPGRGAEGWAEALLPVASDVKISWNGATARTAEAIMPGLSFEAAVDGVRRFAAARERLAPRLAARPTISFQVTAQEANAGELPEIVRLAARLGVDRVKLNQLQPWFPHLEARSLRRSAEAIERWNAAVRAARAAADEVRLPSGARVVLQNAAPLALDPAAPAPLGPCPFAGREAWIRWDGRLAPCPHPTAAEGALGDLGSVADAPLGELWAAPAFRALVARVPEDPLCRTCRFRRPGGA